MTNRERRGPVDACAGDTIEVSAPGEGVGGYFWHAEVPADAGTIVGEKLGPSVAGVGSGRDKVFRIHLEKVGDTVVRLVQSRLWDSVEGRVIEIPIRCVASEKG